MSLHSVGWKGASNDRRIASFRYRVDAPFKALKSKGHNVELFKPDKVDRYDTVVFSKAYSSDDRKLAARIAGRGGRVIFDICDNHFYNPFDLPRYHRAKTEILEMMSIADRVTCTTEALADIIQNETSGAVSPIVIGDACEKMKRRRVRRPRRDKPVDLLWFGSHGSPNAPCGMTDLLLIREELEALSARRPVVLTVCSNSLEKFAEHIEPMRAPTRYVDWSEEAQAELIAGADAVLLPVTRNPFTECKSHNRLTTAIWAGVPVLATGIQSYVEFAPYCSLDNWGPGFEGLIEDYDAQQAKALASRGYIERVWSMQALVPQWESALDLPEPSPRESRQRRPRRAPQTAYQGRLDAVAGENLTGWARCPQMPQVKLQVSLECDGEIVANAVADIARPDLRAVGMPDHHCGFTIPLRHIGDRAHKQLRVLVTGADYVIGESPLIAGQEVALSVPGPTAAPSATPPAVENPSLAVRLPVEAAVIAQEHLQKNLEAVEALTVELRRTLARSVIAMADSPEMANRLSAVIGLASPGGSEKR